MHTKTKSHRQPLPKSFDGLVKRMPPMAITDDLHLAATADVIDRLMQIDHLSPGQASYLETLTELAEVYEAKHHAIDITGLDGLKHILANAPSPAPTSPASSASTPPWPQKSSTATANSPGTTPKSSPPTSN
jgi:hypothetical protein